MPNKKQLSIVLQKNNKSTSEKSIKRAKRLREKVLKDLGKTLQQKAFNLPSVGISPSKNGYFLVVYLEEENYLVEERIQYLKKEYKIPIVTKIVGKLQLS